MRRPTNDLLDKHENASNQEDRILETLVFDHESRLRVIESRQQNEDGAAGVWNTIWIAVSGLIGAVLSQVASWYFK